MNKLNRSKNLSHFSARTLALLSVAAALAAGCAANPSRVEQAIAAGTGSVPALYQHDVILEDNSCNDPFPHCRPGCGDDCSQG
jgi:hypothetical protein